MKGKKSIVNLIIFVFLFSLCGCAEVKIKEKIVEVELGETIPNDVFSYIEVEENQKVKIAEGAELDLTAINADVAGNYNARIYYKNQVIEIPVRVRDTTSPIITAKDEVYEGSQWYEPEQLVSVNDLSDFDLSVIKDDGAEENEVYLRPGCSVRIKAVDKYKNEAFIDVKPVVTPTEEDRVPENRKMEYITMADYNRVKYVDKEAYQTIKKAYEKIPWYGEFPLGDSEYYELCKDKYKSLLKNEVPFYNPSEKKEMYVEDYFKWENILHEGYYYYDIDGDNIPELWVQQQSSNSVVFKYEAEQDQFILWGPEFGEPVGSLGIEWTNLRDYSFYQLDTEGNIVLEVCFRELGYANIFGEDEVACMVTMPQYYNEETINDEEQIKEQGYYDLTMKVYYYRVNEEQFEQLTKDYYQSREEARKKIEEISYTYEEIMEW